MMQISMSLAPQNADDGADSNGCYSGAGGRGFDAAGMADQHARVGNSPFNPRVSFSGTGGAVYSERMMLRFDFAPLVCPVPAIKPTHTQPFYRHALKMRVCSGA
jgi:hypothetical protein